MIHSTRQSDRYPQFCAVARAHDVLSTLSMPMIADHHPIGAMNLYAIDEDAFHDDDIATARIFAMQAGFVLANAQAYWDARSLSEGIAATIRTRAIVERATGMLMNRHEISAGEAATRLADEAHAQGISTGELARRMVADRQP